MIQGGKKNVIFHSHDYAITKESSTFYGVYEYDYIMKNILGDYLITSGKTFSLAKKKLRLLQMGYDRRKDETDDWH